MVPIEEIEYYFEAYTPNSGGRGTDWKSFEHYKRWFDVKSTQELVYPTDTWISGWPNSNNAYHTGRHKDVFYGWSKHSGLAAVMTPNDNWYDTGLERGFTPFPVDLDGLKQRALASMVPQMRAQLSLVNSLYELKDFKGSIRTLVQRAKTSALYVLAHKAKYKGTTAKAISAYLNQNLQMAYNYLKANPKSQIAKAAVKSASGAFLQWKFAVAPLMSDITALRRALAEFERRMNKLISREGRPQRSHFTCTVREYDVYSHKTLYNMGYPLVPRVYGQCAINTTVIPDPSEFHAELEFNCHFSAYQREHARMLSLLDALGVNFNPSIVWNAIPFTFILDWVIDVGRYLDQYKVGNMEPIINIRRFLWSIKRKRTTVWDKTLTSTGGMYGTYKVSMPAVTETSYKRVVESPTRSSLITSGLSSSEFILGAALIVARRRKRRKK